MSSLIATNTVEAHVSAGRWCARCSSPHCDAAVEFNALKPPFYPTFTPAVQCWECGEHTEVIWPTPEMLYGIERLLLLRRNPNTQNWYPGETLNDLQVENAVHGVYDFVNGIEAAPGTPLMIATDRELRTDMLPVLNPRRELRAVER
jgi:hypothetical protein